MEHHKTIRFTIKNVMNFLSARPDLSVHSATSIAFYCSFHDLSSLSLLMNTTSSSPTFRTKNFEARRRKKSKDYYRSDIQHGKLRSTAHYLLIHLWTSFVLFFIQLSAQKNLRRRNHSSSCSIADDDRLNFYRCFFPANLHLTSCGEVFAILNRRDVSWNIQGQKSQRFQTDSRSTRDASD